MHLELLFVYSLSFKGAKKKWTHESSQKPWPVQEHNFLLFPPCDQLKESNGSGSRFDSDLLDWRQVKVWAKCERNG